MNTIIIGIAGGTGSGKTTLTERLRDHFGIDEVSVINHDSYYKRHDELPYEERCKLNYDHPDSFDTPLMVAHLRELRAGHPVQVPVYDYTIHNRSNETVLVRPAPVIIVEGILIFDSPELCDLMDMKVFVDTDADVRILRRIVRDVKERGRTLDSVVTQYLTTVKPMHEQFVEPSKRKADLIVPEGGQNTVALELLIKWVDNHLRAEGESRQCFDEIIYIICKIRRGSRTVWFDFLFFVIYNDLQNKVIRFVQQHPAGRPGNWPGRGPGVLLRRHRLSKIRRPVRRPVRGLAAAQRQKHRRVPLACSPHR